MAELVLFLLGGTFAFHAGSLLHLDLRAKCTVMGGQHTHEIVHSGRS